MKTLFSSVVIPPAPKQCCKRLRGCLFVSNIEKGGRGGYLEEGRGEFTPRVKNVVYFHVSQQLLSMIVASESLNHHLEEKKVFIEIK